MIPAFLINLKAFWRQAHGCITQVSAYAPLQPKTGFSLMTIKPMSVWIGFDPRETATFMVARESGRQFDRSIPVAVQDRR